MYFYYFLFLLDLIMNDGSTTNSKANCDGPEVKGGDPHILIVYACCPNLTGTTVVMSITCIKRLKFSKIWKNECFYVNKCQ